MRFLVHAQRRWLGGVALPLTFILSFPFWITACSLHEDTNLSGVKSSGAITILTRQSPSTYIDTPDGPSGFEYDLATAFADSLGVQARFVVVDRHVDIVRELENNDADMAAAGIAATAELADRFMLSPPYQRIRQQVVFRLGTPPPARSRDLIGREIMVHAGSNHAARLRELRSEYDELLWTEVDDKESEELLEMVWEGLLEITIANSNIIDLNRQFFPELQVAFDISEPEPLVWAFPKSEDHSLYDAAVEFLKQYEAAGELGRLLDRYYGPAGNASFVNTTVYHARIRNRLPQYQSLFQTAGRIVDLDWRLLAAVSYQESYWDASAVSHTGVRGIMMLTEKTAKEVGVTNLLDPEQSVLGGGRYLRDLYDRLDYIPLPDRTWFALAAYNVGLGHLEDARILTQRAGKDPSNWNEVKQHLPLLAQQRWYKRTRYGFARGREPVQFVNRVRAYYDILVKLDEDERAKTRSDALKLKIPSI